jgi:acetyl esterase/lipase
MNCAAHLQCGVDPSQLLDPEVAPVVALMQFDLTTEVLAMIRGAMPAAELSDEVTRTDYVVPGEPSISIRVHRPVNATGTLPCVYSIHGGGYVLGSYSMDDASFDRWCPQLGIVGVSVEYRLAPETPFPGPLEDCYRGLQWVVDNADELGVDPACIGVHGISAGGGLAAALALLTRDRGGPALAFQLLDCPMLDDRQQTVSSQVSGLAVWSKESNTFGWRAYLGDLYGTADVPIHAAPARATDLRGLPPAFVSVGTVDGFHDEDVDYAVRLNHAHVPTELHVYPGAPHGYQMAAESDLAKRAWRDKTDWLRRQLG